MKLKNKRGFVLIETLIVSVFVVGIFTFLYISIIPLVGKYEDKIKKEADIDIVYKLYHLRKLIKNDTNMIDIENSDYKMITCNDLVDFDKCKKLSTYLELDNYKLFYISKNYENMDNIDSRVVDYLKKNNISNKNIILLYDEEDDKLSHLLY